jgi:hypothetical protein
VSIEHPPLELVWQSQWSSVPGQSSLAVKTPAGDGVLVRRPPVPRGPAGAASRQPLPYRRPGRQPQRSDHRGERNKLDLPGRMAPANWPSPSASLHPRFKGACHAPARRSRWSCVSGGRRANFDIRCFTKLRLLAAPRHATPRGFVTHDMVDPVAFAISAEAFSPASGTLLADLNRAPIQRAGSRPKQHGPTGRPQVRTQQWLP